MKTTAAALPTTALNRPVAPMTTPHIHAEEAIDATGAKLGGAEGEIRTETLPNGVRLIVADRPGAPAARLQVGIGAGSLQDPPGKDGLAHLLEHVAFMDSTTGSPAAREDARVRMGDDWNAYTNNREMVFHGVVPNSDAKQAARLLLNGFTKPEFGSAIVTREKAAVDNEMIVYSGEVSDNGVSIASRLLFGEHPVANPPIGTRKTVGTIEPRDLKAYHQQYFTGRNTVAFLEGDAKHLPLDTFRRELGKLPPGSRVDNNVAAAPVVPGPALQVVNDPSVRNVSLQLMLPIPAAAGAVVKLPDIVLTALNDKLFGLRTKGNLTYGAQAGLEQYPGGQTVLTVRTQVDASKARATMREIVGVLNDARDGFGPTQLALHKKALLSQVRVKEPVDTMTISERAAAAFDTALGSPDFTVPPAESPAGLGGLRHLIGRTDEAQFTSDASAMIDFSNMKVLATGALADGGKSLLGGLKDLGLDTSIVTMNPVDLAPYRDMGMKVTKQTVPPLK
ncbi:MAG: putative zinc protease [Thermoleophilia bacterium]|nr:putative zinc protease [Thermoleophilia bacterium]